MSHSPSGWLMGLLIVFALLVGCGRKDDPRQNTGIELRPVAVRTQTVESKKWPSAEEVVGTVCSRIHATVEAKISGRIAEMPIVLGQKVTKGQLLARLDAAEIQARLKQAQAGLQQAERDWKRVSSLFQQQAVTRSESEAAESHHLVAKGAVEEAQAMMAYVEVLAPFDGVVARKWADVGDLATPAKPLVEVEDPSALQLEADVPEAISTGIHSGARMTLRVDSLPAELYGRVAEIAPAADTASRTFRVKLDLSPDPLLKPGQFARLFVPTGERDSLRVPASAVVQRGQMELVFTIENQRARLHLVKTGRRTKSEAEILSGLDAGDVVVSEGGAQLVDGQPVTLQ